MQSEPTNEVSPTGPTSPARTPDWAFIARWALNEDDAERDVTTALLGAVAERNVTGRFVAEEDCVVAGLPLVQAVFAEMDGETVFDAHVKEGQIVHATASLAIVSGPARAVLGGERVALNFLQRLCGVASITYRAVQGTRGTRAVVTDTRKTTPGLRDLEKYAVRIGGGVNHRRSLADAVLWKDNHWALLRASGHALSEVVRNAPDGVPVQVEVETEEQLTQALDAGVRFLLVDNQPPEVIARWMERLGPGVTVEASGGITPEQVAAYAQAGVHRISIGGLTHSAPSASIKLEVDI
jgi:nicotinate-nucleotide pyrophosphorylase (carboxylating)